MGAVLAQLPVRTPDVDWTGLLPVLLPAAGALVLVTGRRTTASEKRGIVTATWAFTGAVCGPIASSTTSRSTESL